ncbi:MAG: PD-(D/E)XK nuclease family protein [Burkholderiales bacterium]|nr:PD-(D/E)XK nuclease family protein [Burkholderiales bacterium]
MTDALHRALARGATVVTPNRRLARHLIGAFDRANRAAGARAWSSARALPWPAFVLDLEREAMASGALAPRVRLSGVAVAELWRQVLEADGIAALDVGGLASAASEAWELVHAYGNGGESWRAWAGGADDPAAFARWAERYREALDARHAVDAATAPDRLSGVDQAFRGWHGREVVFAGFIEPTPQQLRLAERLRERGAVVAFRATVEAAEAGILRGAYASTTAELCAALAWARRIVEASPDARVGIVVPELAARRAEVRLRAIDVLGMPEDETLAAWNLSLGAPLADVPLVAAATDLIALAWGRLPVGRAAAWLRSAYLPGASSRTLRGLRASIERSWLERAVETVDLDAVTAELARRNDPLATSLVEVGERMRTTPRATRRGLVDAWRAVLEVAGWPGDRALSSAAHQARAALDEAFAQFAALDALSASQRDVARLEGGAAIAAFTAQVAASPFQPESADAPIQILGLYEAVGLPFDALWISGMDDETLPRAMRPHPLIPIAWQRDRGAPRSDPARELAFARALAGTLRQSAPTVVVSHARRVDDRPALPTDVFPRGVPVDAPVPPLPAQTMFARRPLLERMVDATAPPLASDERLSRGSGLVTAQSDCPFQALAACRWRADRWPQAQVGLSPMERGNLIHAALAAFWREVRDHAGLVALRSAEANYRDTLQRVANAALGVIDATRWRRLPPAVRAGEAARLERTMDDWLAIETERPPFEVLDVEHETSLALAPLRIGLRLDRIDRLADGGVAILDYKSGRVPSAGRWQDDRPKAVQMGLYTLAWREAHPDDRVRAAVLACLKRGETKAVGLYADGAARVGAAPKAKGNDVVDWPLLEARWAAVMGALVRSFADGEALVSPRKAALCQTCARQALCRVDGFDDDDADDGDGVDSGEEGAG